MSLESWEIPHIRIPKGAGAIDVECSTCKRIFITLIDNPNATEDSSTDTICTFCGGAEPVLVWIEEE